MAYRYSIATPSIAQKSLHFYHRALKLCRQPIPHSRHHPHLSPTTRHSHTHPLILNHAHTHAPLFNNFPRSVAEFNHLGSSHFLVSAMPDGGGGGYGSFGGGASGGGSGDGAGKWSLLSWYLALLGKYPIAVKALTSAVLTLIGDLICQLVIDQVPSLDVKRTFIFTLLGFVLVGPTLHLWYLYLSKLVTMPGASGAFLRLILDQFLFAPSFIGIFLATLVTLEGRPSQVIPKLQQEWFSSVLANWQLWIPFQFLNFRFVPQQFQVLAANVISLVWNVILSYKAHKEVIQK